METVEVLVKAKQDAEIGIMRRIISSQNDSIVQLKKALEPFAKKYLWPDDSGYADELRADEDWSEVGNDDTLDSCLIQRKWIRDAREALKEKE